MADRTQYPYVVGRSVFDDMRNLKILMRGQRAYFDRRKVFMKDTVKMMGKMFDSTPFKEPRPDIPVLDQELAPDQQPAAPNDHENEPSLQPNDQQNDHLLDEADGARGDYRIESSGKCFILLS